MSCSQRKHLSSRSVCFDFCSELRSHRNPSVSCLSTIILHRYSTRIIPRTDCVMSLCLSKSDTEDTQIATANLLKWRIYGHNCQPFQQQFSLSGSLSFTACYPTEFDAHMDDVTQKTFLCPINRRGRIKETQQLCRE